MSIKVVKSHYRQYYSLKIKVEIFVLILDFQIALFIFFMNLTTLELATIYFYFIKLGHFIPTAHWLPLLNPPSLFRVGRKTASPYSTSPVSSRSRFGNFILVSPGYWLVWVETSSNIWRLLKLPLLRFRNC